MNDNNEMVTKAMFYDGINRVDARIDALALLAQQEFVVVRKEMADGFSGVWKKIGEMEEKMATKQDLFRMENRILAAIGDITAELKSHNVRILTLERIIKP